MRLLTRLHSTHQRIVKLFAEACTDITTSQLLVLAAVDTHPGSSQTMLVEVAGVDRSTMADTIRRLQRHGFVKRVRSRRDARAYQVGITAAGRKALAAGLTAIKTAEQQLVSEFPAVRGLAA